MVTALIVVVLVIGIAGGLFIKVASSYGGVKPFLAKELKSERETLAMHRKKVKALEKSAKGELSSATKDLKSAEKEYTKRVGDPVRRPGQIFISSGAVGLGGENFAVPGPRWWVLDVPR